MTDNQAGNTPIFSHLIISHLSNGNSQLLKNCPWLIYKTMFLKEACSLIFPLLLWLRTQVWLILHILKVQWILFYKPHIFPPPNYLGKFLCSLYKTICQGFFFKIFQTSQLITATLWGMKNQHFTVAQFSLRLMYCTFLLQQKPVTFARKSVLSYPNCAHNGL